MTESVVEKIKDTFEGVISDRKTLVRILTVALILLVAVILRIHESKKADITVESVDETGEIEQVEEGTSDIQIIFVDIGGAVATPGVYQVAKETRLYQVIEMAGGLTENADTDSVNRASFVEDGQKIIIPVKGGETAAGEASDAAVSQSAAQINAAGLVNINTATADELKSLNGIGDVMAQRIIEYRTSKAFKSKEDIMSVDGIGEGIYAKIKDRITV